MTIGEISKGIAALESGRKRAGLQNWLEVDVRSWFGGRILPITEAIAQRRGSLAAEAKKTGSPITVVDGLIAATALYHDLVLVTRISRTSIALELNYLIAGDVNLLCLLRAIRLEYRRGVAAKCQRVQKLPW